MFSSGRVSRRLIALVAVFVAVSALAVGCSDDSSDSTTVAYRPPTIKHVWTIVLENKSYEASFTGLNKNSYLWQTLPSYGLLARQYYGTSHFSEGNYLSMVSGQATSPGPQDDCPVYNETGPVTEVADGQYKIDNLTKKADGTFYNGSAEPGCVLPRQVSTMFNQFDDEKVSYKGYMQDMGADPAREPSTCGNPLGSAPGPAVKDPGSAQGPYAPAGSEKFNTTDDQYVAKHNPFVWFHSLLDSSDCAKHVVPLAKNLLQDLKSKDTTPAFSWITPNNCSDAHDATCVGDNLSGGSNALTGEKKTPTDNQGGLKAADTFLQQIIPAIMASPAYQDGGLIDVTFDEGFPPYKQYSNSIADKDADPKNVSGSGNTAQSVVACCNELHGPNTTQPGDQAFGQDTTPGGGITGAILLSPFITPGSVTDQPYNHYSWLRSIEDLFGVDSGGTDGRGHLGYAGAEGLRPFGPDVYNNREAKHLEPAASGTGGVYAAVAQLSGSAQPISREAINGAP